MGHPEAWVWVFIPIVAILSGVARRWFSLKERELDRLAERTAEQSATSAAETERLKQRVAVLERILTDRSTHLGDQIDALRDRPIN